MHPSQQDPQRTVVSRATAKPRPAFRHGMRPRRWRTGNGPKFPPDPAREPKVLPPHARPARAARRPSPLTEGDRLLRYALANGDSELLYRATDRQQARARLRPGQRRRVKHKTGHLLALGALK